MSWNKKPTNIEEIIKEMSSLGLRIINKEDYITGETKLNMIDNLGYMYFVSPYAVRFSNKRNNFIRKFSKVNKFTIHNIKNFLKLINSTTKLLSEEYTTINDEYLFECGKCKKTFKCTLDYLVNSNQRNKYFTCSECARVELSSKQRTKYKEILMVFSENNLEPMFKEDDYKNSQSKLKYKTIDGYLGEIAYGHLKSRGMKNVSMFQQNSKYFEHNINLLCNTLGVKFNSVFEYKENTNKTLLAINCSECNEIFYTTKANLVKGKTRCNLCTKKKSKIEKKTEDWLKKYNIIFEEQKKFDDLKYKNCLSFDFYLEDLNIAIECDGEFHYSTNTLLNEDGFALQKLRDGIKNKYCKDNNIKLLRIPYWEFKNKKYEKILIDNILNQK